MTILDEIGKNELFEVGPATRLMGNNRGDVDVCYNVQRAADGPLTTVLYICYSHTT